VLKSIND